MAKPDRRRVLVVGGGVAGVTAAAELARAGAEVVLLERGRRLGGRASSGRLAGFGEADYGFHVLMRTCSQARRLVKLLGMEKAVRFQKFLSVPLWREGRFAWVRSFPVVYLLPFLLHFRHLSLRERLGTLRLFRGLWQRDLGDITVREWLESLGQSEGVVENLLVPLFVATLNSRPEETSAHFGAMVLRRVLFSPRGGALGFFQVPMSRVWEGVVPLVEQAGGEVQTEARVKKVLISQGKVAGVSLSTGQELEGDAVVAAVPPDDLSSLLPEERQGFARAHELKWAPIVCVHLLFARSVMPLPFFFALGLPLESVFSLSKLQGRTDGPEHVVIVQSAAWNWVHVPPEEAKEALLSALAEVVPQVEKVKVLSSLVLRFPRATFIPGPGILARRPDLTPPPGLFLAGDYTRTDWPATIEGASRSGATASQGCLRYLAPEG